MKKMAFVFALIGLSVAQANTHIYFQNPTYCRAHWTCDIVSTDWRTATSVCAKEPWANQVATVYQQENDVMSLKGYGCFDPLYTGGPN
jgi:hypothetical protein